MRALVAGGFRVAAPEHRCDTYRQMYKDLMDLRERGLDPSDRNARAPELLRERARQIGLVADALVGTDERYTAVGHSLGGSTALLVGATDPRCLVSCALAPNPAFVGLHPPPTNEQLVVLCSEDSLFPIAETRDALGRSGWPLALVELEGAHHFAFADASEDVRAEFLHLLGRPVTPESKCTAAAIQSVAARLIVAVARAAGAASSIAAAVASINPEGES